MVPGISGNIKSPYLSGIYEEAQKYNYDIALINHRGTQGAEIIVNTFMNIINYLLKRPNI